MKSHIFTMYLLFMCTNILLHSILQNLLLNMLQLGKIFCKSHPNETVSNFCSCRIHQTIQEQCRLGLCPSCLCEHTQMHNEKRTLPRYENIRNTFSRVHLSVQEQQKTINKDMDRLNDVFRQIQHKKHSFKDTLNTAKEQCLQYVTQCFDKMAEHWQEQIAHQEKASELHNKYKLESLGVLIQKEMERLVEAERELNNCGFQEKVRRIQTETLVQSRGLHQRVSKELEENQHYYSGLIYRKEHFGELNEVIKKIVTLAVKLPWKRVTTYTTQAPVTPQKRIAVVSTPKQSPADYKASRITINNQSDISRVYTTGSRGVSPSAQTKLSNFSTVTNVPKVLTSSMIQLGPSYPRPELKLNNASSVLDQAKTSKSNFGPNYGIELGKYAKNDKIEMGKQGKKKAGLVLTTPNKNQSMLRDKQNTN